MASFHPIANDFDLFKMLAAERHSLTSKFVHLISPMVIYVANSNHSHSDEPLTNVGLDSLIILALILLLREHL